MEKMLASMLSNMVPPEVLAALSPEKIQEYSDGIKTLIVSFQMRLDALEDTQLKILDLLERSANERSNNSGRGSRKPARITDGTGSNNGSA